MTSRGLEIKHKLLELGKTQRALVKEIRARGLNIGAPDLSKALNDPYFPREFEAINMAYEICLDWEAERKKQEEE